MQSCCIGVTALLECFKWTLNKPHNRTGGVASTALSMPSGQGSTFGTISCYYDLIFKRRVPLDHYWYQKGGMVIVTFKTND